MQPLPIDSCLPAILASIKERGALVLVAPPGSGKTTRVPPAMAEGLSARGRVLVLPPRRIAARAAAARIARERGWTVGREVGYTVRFESRVSRDTRLEVVTEGILTRRLQIDPFLENVSAVVLDEFHERSIHADLALAILREVRSTARPDLAVVVMSATLDPGPVSQFLGNAPVVTAGGRPYPVEIRYLDAPDRSPIHDLAAQAVRDMWDEGQGHVLVFLPGIAEIRRTSEALESFSRSTGAVLTPLHGSLSLDEQERALGPSSTRKIVLSTNIAETSLTIEGVDVVIDSGKARVLRNDPRHGIDRLEVERISKHSAEQRAGRAGRLAPGKTLRLWTRAEQTTMSEADTPEIERVDLAATVVELRSWGVADPRRFEWFEAPDAAALERAEELLLALGAVETRNGPLTGVGRSMLTIPAHPRLARMLVAAHAVGLLKEGAALAALVEERDIVPIHSGPHRVAMENRRAREVGPSDLLVRLDLLAEAERASFRPDRCRALEIDPFAARAVSRSRDALLRSARDSLGPEHKASTSADPETALRRVLLHGFPDRVCRRRAQGSDRGRMTGGRGVVLAPESIVKDDDLFLAIELDENVRGERLEARVRLASAVRRKWLEEDLSHFLNERTETRFDAQSEKVRATTAMCYRDLPLEDPREIRPPADEADRVLVQAARERVDEVLARDETATAWLLRVRALREWMPELGLPAFTMGELSDLLASACTGKTSFAELRAAGLIGPLKSRLTHTQLSQVERNAPETIQVPTGNRIRITYESGRPPVLAVRLQELFGLADTPTVAAGRVCVLLHLLGPNYRPVQITQDLKSFWSTTYAQVRKDLRARYPKHAWPEDPWTASPQVGARRKRS